MTLLIYSFMQMRLMKAILRKQKMLRKILVTSVGIHNVYNLIVNYQGRRCTIHFLTSNDFAFCTYEAKNSKKKEKIRRKGLKSYEIIVCSAIAQLY